MKHYNMKVKDFLKQRVAKNTLKKPRNIKLQQPPDFYMGYCPNCPMGVHSKMKYCIECGQRLDWRIDNENNGG